MTMDEMAARLATMHDTTGVIVVERWTVKDQLYLASNLRPLLGLLGGSVKAVNTNARTVTIRKQNKSEATLEIVTSDDLVNVLRRFVPGTRLFTMARSGIFESTI